MSNEFQAALVELEVPSFRAPARLPIGIVGVGMVRETPDPKRGKVGSRVLRKKAFGDLDERFVTKPRSQKHWDDDSIHAPDAVPDPETLLMAREEMREEDTEGGDARDKVVITKPARVIGLGWKETRRTRVARVGTAQQMGLVPPAPVKATTSLSVLPPPTSVKWDSVPPPAPKPVVIAAPVVAKPAPKQAKPVRTPAPPKKVCKCGVKFTPPRSFPAAEHCWDCHKAQRSSRRMHGRPMKAKVGTHAKPATPPAPQQKLPIPAQIMSQIKSHLLINSRSQQWPKPQLLNWFTVVRRSQGTATVTWKGHTFTVTF